VPYEAIQLTFEQHVAILTLNDPTRLNAVSHTMITELNQAMQEVEDPAHGARCLVLTGAGRGFCSGANLQERRGAAEQQDKPPWSSSILESHYHPFLRRLRQLNMPFLTAVNGPAAGVGASLALMGDLVLAAKTTYFLLAFRHIGLMPDGGATYILPRLIGLGRAMEMAMLGERIPAEQALQWGMINRVYDNEALLPEALQLAQRLAAGPTVALKLIRQALWQSLDNTYEQQLTVEALGQQEARRTTDYREGVAAFLEKRQARFTGQ
jgi:2-(1,2-epoxy-1,2-dihydrophenyl)acetyl-CoA isomerase